MDGIDTLNGKLISYARALKHLIPSTCEWLIIRDTDCVPINKKITAGNDDKKDVDTSGAPISVLFQDGYGIESTFLSDHSKFARLITNYYELDPAEEANIQSAIVNLINTFTSSVKDITHPIHKKWIKHFERQLKVRSGRAYKDLRPEHVLQHITANTIQYVMTKDIMNEFLLNLHGIVSSNYPATTKPELTSQSIFTYYYSWLTGLNDMFDAHKLILTQIYS